MKRPYSREFPRQDNSKEYALQGIPAGLLRAARAKAKREHVSLRIVLLRLLTGWASYGLPTEDGKALDTITRLLDGCEWNGADTLDAIAAALRDTGRVVREVSEVKP